MPVLIKVVPLKLKIFEMICRNILGLFTLLLKNYQNF